MPGLGYTGVSYGDGLTRFSRTPVTLGSSMQRTGVRYPNPFFDAAQTYFPARLKQMLQWCRYFFFTNPLINAVVYKLAEYPITKIIYEADDKDVRERYRHLFEDQLQVRKFQIEVGLDYYNYGNAFVTVHFPFVKHLKCRHCGHKAPIDKLRRHYRYQEMVYYLTCPECGERRPAEVHDEAMRTAKGIRLVRWDPERVEIDDNEGVTDPTYFYKLPQKLKNAITIGRRNVIETVPDTFIEAMRKKKSVKFAPGTLFHLKRPIIAQKDQGWGMPLVLPVLKDIFYLQVLRKGQEMIAQEHIVPLRVLYPQANGQTGDPITMINLGEWKDQVQEEIARWRQDPNYIPLMPIPLGHEMIGGQGRALILHQELRVWSEQIIAGMNVPIEFIFGGMQYTGTNVSMRILENQFSGYRDDQLRLVGDFVMGRICEFLGWPRVPIRFERFKMADDLQRLMVYFQANQAMKISDTTFLRELGEDLETEEKRKKQELVKQVAANREMVVAQAAAQGEAQLAALRYEIQAQHMQMQMQQPPESPPSYAELPQTQPSVMRGEQIGPGVPDGAAVYVDNLPQEVQSPMHMGQMTGGNEMVDVRFVARRIATEMRRIQDEQPAMFPQAMQKLRMGSPDIYRMVQALLSEGDGGQRDTLNPLQQPLPEQKPPRRPLERAVV